MMSSRIITPVQLRWQFLPFSGYCFVIMDQVVISIRL